MGLNRHWGKNWEKILERVIPGRHSPPVQSSLSILAPMATKQTEGTSRYLIRLHIREHVLGENHATRASTHSHTPANRSHNKPGLKPHNRGWLSAARTKLSYWVQTEMLRILCGWSNPTWNSTIPWGAVESMGRKESGQNKRDTILFTTFDLGDSQFSRIEKQKLSSAPCCS